MQHGLYMLMWRRIHYHTKQIISVWTAVLVFARIQVITTHTQNHWHVFLHPTGDSILTLFCSVNSQWGFFFYYSHLFEEECFWFSLSCAVTASWGETVKVPWTWLPYKWVVFQRFQVAFLIYFHLPFRDEIVFHLPPQFPCL